MGNESINGDSYSDDGFYWWLIVVVILLVIIILIISLKASYQNRIPPAPNNQQATIYNYQYNIGIGQLNTPTTSGICGSKYDGTLVTEQSTCQSIGGTFVKNTCQCAKQHYGSYCNQLCFPAGLQPAGFLDPTSTQAVFLSHDVPIGTSFLDASNQTLSNNYYGLIIVSQPSTTSSGMRFITSPITVYLSVELSPITFASETGNNLFFNVSRFQPTATNQATFLLPYAVVSPVQISPLSYVWLGNQSPVEINSAKIPLQTIANLSQEFINRTFRYFNTSGNLLVFSKSPQYFSSTPTPSSDVIIVTSETGTFVAPSDWGNIYASLIISIK